MPEWEYQLRVQAASPDHDITEFASASFTQLLVAATHARSRAELVDRIRRVRAKVDEELVGDVRYDEFRDLLWAGCVWWRIEDPEPTHEQYASYVKVKGLRGPSRDRRNLNRRTFRHAWAGYHYRRGVQRERGPSDLLGRDERAGRSEPLKSRIQDALVALLYAIVDGDDVTAFWDPAANTLRRPRPDSGAAADHDTDSTAATAQLDVEEGEPPTGEESQGDQVDSPSRASGPWAVLERSWDVVRRHPGWTGVGALVAAMLVVALIGASTQWFGLVASVDETPSGVIDLPAGDEEGHQITPATWGPTDRDVVSVQSRNSVVTLNSMVDNPVQGDERNFMQIRPSTAGNESYTDELVLTPGDVYVGYVYFKNDASPDAADAVAENTRLKLEVPGVVHGSANAYARLSSDNAVPGEVWDGITLVLPEPNQEAALRYVSGSATLHTGGAADGTPLDDALFEAEGVLLGCDALDGNLPSRDECGGYVTFELRVDQPAFTVAASARVKGSTDPFASQVVATVGDVLDVRVTYQNTGTNQQDNVSLKIHDLPEGLRYVKESSQIANSKTGGDYHDTVDGVTTNGYNLGSYQPKGNVFFKFDLIIDESMLADDRGSRWIEIPSFARITTNAGYIDAPLTLTLLRDSVPTTSSLDATDPDYWRASWGPQREMYSYQSGGAPYPVFNSISDNPNIGDERNFVGLRLDDGSDGDHVWYDHVWAKPGETYLMRVYVNNAGADSNDAYEAGRLQGVRLQAGMSRSKTGTEASVYGLLTAKQKPSPVCCRSGDHRVVPDAGAAVRRRRRLQRGKCPLGPDPARRHGPGHRVGRCMVASRCAAGDPRSAEHPGCDSRPQVQPAIRGLQALEALRACGGCR